MKYIMLNEYLQNNMLAKTKENEKYIASEITNNVFTEWNDKLERFTYICDKLGCCFRFFLDGRIVMEDELENNDCNCEWKGKTELHHMEYKSIDDMLNVWDYTKNLV